MSAIPGKLFAVYLLATVLACGVGAWLAARYRRALLPLMRAPTLAGTLRTLTPTHAVAKMSTAWRDPRPLDEAGHQASTRNLVVALLLLSLLIALTRGVLWWLFVQDPGKAFNTTRFITLSFIYAWPALPALGLIWRWRWHHLFLALAVWYAASVGGAALLLHEGRNLYGAAAWLLWEAGWPVLALMLLTLPSTRATAPWLWLPMSIVGLMALAGVDAMGALAASGSQPLHWLPPSLAVAAFAVAGAAMAAWPAWQFGRVLAQAYSDKWVSELIVVYSAAWVLNLVFEALSDGPVMLLPLLWLPAAVVAGRWFFQLQGTSNAPTLLVLRVFSQHPSVAALFEDVVESWRVSGRTVLIAGTDLVHQTLDAADLLGFLEGRLADRFVVGEGDVQRCLAEFDWERDPDGRFRVNECYCHDTSWKHALAALVYRSSHVLIDLRGFTASNAGCRYELAVLSRAPHLQRVVAVVDDRSDLAAALQDVAAAPPGRFVWLNLASGAAAANTSARARVIAALLAPKVALAP